METKERVAALSGKLCRGLVCPWCKGDHFKVEVEDYERGHITGRCDCGYGISFNYGTSCLIAEAAEEMRGDHDRHEA